MKPYKEKRREEKAIFMEQYEREKCMMIEMGIYY